MADKYRVRNGHLDKLSSWTCPACSHAIWKYGRSRLKKAIGRHLLLVHGQRPHASYCDCGECLGDGGRAQRLRMYGCPCDIPRSCGPPAPKSSSMTPIAPVPDSG